MSKKNALECECGGSLVQIVDSRPSEFFGVAAVYRRRLCDKCHKRTTTWEIPESIIEAARRKAITELIHRLVDEVI